MEATKKKLIFDILLATLDWVTGDEINNTIAANAELAEQTELVYGYGPDDDLDNEGLDHGHSVGFAIHEDMVELLTKMSSFSGLLAIKEAKEKAT
jgi:hypothetical protein